MAERIAENSTSTKRQQEVLAAFEQFMKQVERGRRRKDEG
jgi:hypothetical protein